MNDCQGANKLRGWAKATHVELNWTFIIDSRSFQLNDNDNDDDEDEDDDEGHNHHGHRHRHRHRHVIIMIAHGEKHLLTNGRMNNEE